MKKIAILLALTCGGLYGWGHYQTLMSEQNNLAAEKVTPPKEVFPQSMKNVAPLSQVQKLIDEQKAAKKAAEEAKRLEEEKLAAQKALEAKKKAEAEALAKQKELEKQLAEQERFCVKAGQFTSKQLPSVNQALKAAKLLEKVQVKPIFGQDRFVVFIIPTTTSKGAQALVTQVKAKGYANAQVITSGPLTNATRLNVFDNEATALSYMEKAKQTLKMKSIRMTRLMGEPTGNVVLVFENVTKKEKGQLQKIAQKHKKQLQDCPIE